MREGLLLAYHDRSDGGLFATAARWPSPDIAASRSTSTLCYDPLMNDVDGSERRGADRRAPLREKAI
jgi:phosphoribosylformylglycinamidine synthase